MSDVPDALATTIATWLYQLHAAGEPATHDGIRRACEAVRAAEAPQAGEEAGRALVREVEELLGGSEPDHDEAAARAAYGDRVGRALGEGDRDARTAAIRRYQFAVGLPWMARIWERRDGAVAPGWVIVERVTDEVLAMDPNPWDDVDEERHIPVGDFHVLWELDGCPSVHLVPAGG